MGGDAYGFEVFVEPFGHFDDVGAVCCVSADPVFIFVVSMMQKKGGGREWAYEGMATASASLLMKALALASTKDRNSGGAGMLGDLGSIGEKTTIIISRTQDQS